MIKFTNNLSKKSLHHQESIEDYLERARKKCEELRNHHLNIKEEDHHYSIETTKDELGLDDELINSLLDDFVIQMISTLPQFRQIIKEMRQKSRRGEVVDFNPLKDLAHKNLGVARNLRVKDAQKILYFIMNNNNLEEIERSLEYLEACMILLKPDIAYKIYTK